MNGDEFEPAVDSPDGVKIGGDPEHLSGRRRLRPAVAELGLDAR